MSRTFADEETSSSPSLCGFTRAVMHPPESNKSEAEAYRLGQWTVVIRIAIKPLRALLDTRTGPGERVAATFNLAVCFRAAANKRDEALGKKREYRSLALVDKPEIAHITSHSLYSALAQLMNVAQPQRNVARPTTAAKYQPNQQPVNEPWPPSRTAAETNPPWRRSLALITNPNRTVVTPAESSIPQHRPSIDRVTCLAQVRTKLDTYMAVFKMSKDSRFYQHLKLEYESYQKQVRDGTPEDEYLNVNFRFPDYKQSEFGELAQNFPEDEGIDYKDVDDDYGNEDEADGTASLLTHLGSGRSISG
ncbi:hypothetical protein B0H63DRAFT_527653 [Podospora didyma]|uniref:Uncharacterized protein n=1 Tax=Podospora didyma TaxID=330526 RepID=A0AAE0K5A2_9PEZI|nr:hypothetical protein B0H63DRAFT_527653 [Podospora didyma]